MRQPDRSLARWAYRKYKKLRVHLQRPTHWIGRISRLLNHRSTEEAARAVGIAPKTLLRWLQIPEFDTAYRRARRDAFAQSTGRLQQASSAAVTTLLKIMTDVNAPAASRVRAADSVLVHTHRAIELDDIEARISELERVAEVSNAARNR
jgi:hypothetical protein